jgi:GTP1/Obg family GTP-binding protein
VDQQLGLFASISPLFANKPLVVVATKIDAQPWETLEQGEKSRITAAVAAASASSHPRRTSASRHCCVGPPCS